MEGIISEIPALDLPVAVRDSVDKDYSMLISKIWGQLRIRNETNRRMWLEIYTVMPRRDFTIEELDTMSDVPEICMGDSVGDGETVADSPYGGGIRYQNYGSAPWMFPRLNELFRVKLFRRLRLHAGQLVELRYKFKGFRYDRFFYEQLGTDNITIPRRTIQFMYRYYSEPWTAVDNSDPPVVRTLPAGACQFTVVMDRWLKMYNKNILGQKAFYYTGSPMPGPGINVSGAETQIADTDWAKDAVEFGVGAT